MARVEVRTYVDEEVRDRWQARFKYASMSWLLETAMSETLALLEKDPTLEESVRASIHAHILKNQPQRANVDVATIP